MRSIVLFLFALIATLSVSAQRPNAVRQYATSARKGMRNEIYIPNVMGYNVYKADFHTHTIYSDGDMTPAMRVHEAWLDGLDIIAITDHMEYRRIEREMYRYMKDYIDPNLRGEKWAINTNVLNKKPDERGLLVDFNVGHEMAKIEGKKLDMMVVNGVEITRGKLGDYNALFTTDNNALYDPNLEQTIRNARAQGAFIFHNHPQYSKKTASTMPAHCEDFHAKGLIDGFELANGFNIYNRLIDYCLERGYAPFANSDAHGLISARFPNTGKDYYRNMTLILATERTNEAIKEALNAKRTIAYSANMLIGKEEYLTELFKACVEVKLVGKEGKDQSVLIRNNSSLPFALSRDGKSDRALLANSSIILYVNKKTKVLNLTITNMLYGADKSPKISFKLK